MVIQKKRFSNTFFQHTTFQLKRFLQTQRQRNLRQRKTNFVVTALEQLALIAMDSKDYRNKDKISKVIETLLTPINSNTSGLYSSDLYCATTVDFTFSIWIYVDSWQYKYGKDKTIFRRSNKQGDLSPSVNLAAATNDLNITLVTFPQTSGSTGNTETWKIHNIPLQKWTNIIVATNNRAVDTYIDGKLVNTHVLKGVPKMDKEAPIYLTPDGGFSGNTAKFRYFSRTLSPREAYQIYKDGPGGNMLTDLLNKYKLKVQFLKDNEEINGFEI